MNILVTGGAGFIGSNFILYWLKHHEDDFIFNLDKLTYAGNLENLNSIARNSRYRFIHGDLCDPEVVSQSVKSVDMIVHFAAESHVDRSINKPAPFINSNIIGTYTILEAALKLNIRRFHHVSTDEVFGSLDLESTAKFKENTAYRPSSPYSASKAASDHLVNAYYRTYGLPVTVSNCSNNFGPFQFPEKLIPLAVTNILEGKAIPVYGDGLNVRDWLYVEDHIRAIEMILLKGRIGEIYCIGGMTHDINNLQVIQKIISLMKADKNCIKHIKDREGHDRRYSIDWTKIKNELGWEPVHDFDTWLATTIEWYKANQAWWRRVKSGEYQAYYESHYGGKTS